MTIIYEYNSIQVYIHFTPFSIIQAYEYAYHICIEEKRHNI